MTFHKCSIPVAGIPDEKSDSAALPFSGHRLDPSYREGVNARSPARAARTGLAEPLAGDSTVATSVSLEIDAKLSQFDDCRSAPADRVRGEREREGHPVLLAERLAVAQDVGRFTRPGQFVWHYRIVEHEDNEMMRPYRIDPLQPGQPE